MGIVFCIFIANQHISILQFIVFTEQQITEKLYEERLVWLYSFLRITVIGTYKGVTEVPGIISEQFIVYLEATGTQILDSKIRFGKVRCGGRLWSDEQCKYIGT